MSEELVRFWLIKINTDPPWHLGLMSGEFQETIGTFKTKAEAMAAMRRARRGFQGRLQTPILAALKEETFTLETQLLHVIAGILRKHIPNPSTEPAK